MTEVSETLFDLTGRTALVTGGSRGIGRAIAERLAQHGANVAIIGRNAETAAGVAEAINARGEGRAIGLACNITRTGDLDRVLAETREAFGDVDILVTNAGLHIHVGKSAEMSDEVLAKTIAGNFGALHHLAQAVLPAMLEKGWGRIINIGSVAAHFGSAKYHSYSISKGMAMQYIRNLAVEHGAAGVRSNTISPGFVRTEMAKSIWEDPEMLRNELAHAPIGKAGEPDEIAGMVVALASAAGNYVNGQTIAVDGGQTIHNVD